MNFELFLDACIRAELVFSVQDGALYIESEHDIDIDLMAQIKARKSEVISWVEQKEQERLKGGWQKILPEARTSNQLPLSFAQQRLYFLNRLEGGNAHYNMPTAMRAEGVFDEQIAELAFTRIIERHETLRTVFVDQAEQSLQVIQETFEFALGRMDLRHLNRDEQELAVQAAAKKDAVSDFHLGSDLMLRAMFIRLGEREGVLLINVHHIASDGWSMGLLVNEFMQQYDALSRGDSNPLTPLAIRYADYAQWQRKWLEGEVLEQQLRYWEQKLTDLPATHSLPLDHARPAQPQHWGARHQFSCGKSTLQRLKKLANEQQATLFMVLHGALSILISRHSNSNDVVLGTSVANRMRKELEDIIGFFINTAVLRVDTSGNPSFIDFLARIKATNLEAQAHQDIPFEYLVERLKPARSSRYSPLFQLMFTMNTNELGGINSFALPDIRFETMTNRDIPAKFEILFQAAESEDGIAFSVDYNTALFDATTIQGLGEHLLVLLDAIAANPDAPMHALAMLTDEEQHYLLHTLNATEAPYPKDKCVHELFEEQVARTPDNTALVYEGERLTYAQLNARANQLAHYLREQGVRPDSLVGLYLERSIEMVVGLYGILKAGGAYVPLDPGYPQYRLSYMLDNSKPVLLLTQAALHEKVTQLVPADARLKVESLDTAPFSSLLRGYPETNPARMDGQGADNLAYVIYTSGSTGHPKGVLTENRALVNRISWMQREYALTPADVVLQKTPFSFDVSVWELTWPFTVGASLVMAKPQGHTDLGYLGELIEKQGVTTIHFVPSVLRLMLDEGRWGQYSSLRRVFCSGEALTADVVKRHYAVHAVPLHNLYGPTEAAIDVSYWECPNDLDLTTVPIGKPIQNITLHVLDAYNQIQPLGTPGELHIGGVGLARGYLNRPDLTAERFIANPFYEKDDPANSKRLYKTGDLVRYLADGNIEYLGRMDDQVKIRGLRIELGEIESQLVLHAEVAAAVVLAREDFPGEKRLVAYVTTAPQAEAGSQARQALVVSLKAHLQSVLPNYMVPAQYVLLDSFPLNPSGKVDKKALPLPDAHLEQVEYMAPQTLSEKILVEIWASLLHLDVEQISTTDNFFALGGHSLLIVQMLSRLEQEELHTDIVTIFSAASLGALAATLDAQSTGLAEHAPG